MGDEEVWAEGISDFEKAGQLEEGSWISDDRRRRYMPLSMMVVSGDISKQLFRYSRSIDFHRLKMRLRNTGNVVESDPVEESRVGTSSMVTFFTTYAAEQIRVSQLDRLGISSRTRSKHKAYRIVGRRNARGEDPRQVVGALR